MNPTGEDALGLWKDILWVMEHHVLGRRCVVLGAVVDNGRGEDV